MSGKNESRAAGILQREREGFGTLQPRPEEHTRILDAYFAMRLEELLSGAEAADDGAPFALAAVGGYGRGDVCLRSNVGVVLLYEKTAPPEAFDLAQPLFYPLWDMGYELDHAFRSIKEILSESRKDFQTFTALLDARYIGGSRAVFDSFAEQFSRKVVAKKKKAFLSFLNKNNAARLRKFGDASALLEPDVKEGLGGLRDYHQVLWLGKVFYGADGVEELRADGRLAQAEVDVLLRHASFLHDVRNALHARCDARQDRLTRELQPQVAEELGVSPTDSATAVERFLGRLHREMAALKSLRASFTASLPDEMGRKRRVVRIAPGFVAIGGELHFDATDAHLDAEDVVQAFRLSAERALPLSWQARNLVAAHLAQVRSDLQASPEAVGAFEDILTSGRAAQVVEQMLETGFLAAFIPEFSTSQDYVQFDAYHIHPVGQHTVRMLAALERSVSSAPEPFVVLGRRFAGDIVLMLAAVFHDIGKGQGSGHAARGAVVAEQVLTRWGMDADRIRQVSALVRDHLILRHTATRRDIGDESEVAGCAAVVGTPERLDMLHLFTWADSVATGPGAWTRWTSRLVGNLADRVRRMMEQGGPDGAQAVRRVLRIRDAVRAGLEEDSGDATVDAVLDAMPARYAMAVDVPDILHHVDMLRRLRGSVDEDKCIKPGGKGGDGIFIRESRYVPDGEAWEVSVAAMSSPGLFACVTGVLSLLELNILSAESYQWRNGMTVDVFMVNGLPAAEADELWRRLDFSLRAALTGRLGLEAHLAEKRQAAQSASPARHQTQVSIGSDASDFHTVIEVVTTDRLGLLYDIACTLRDARLDVVFAKVLTQGDKASDAFYVRDGGKKVTSPQRLREVERALHERLDQREGA